MSGGGPGLSSGGSNDGEGGAAAVQPHAETASRIASIHRARMAETVLQRSPSFITRRTRCRGVARHDRFGAMRRAVAIALLGLIEQPFHFIPQLPLLLPHASVTHRLVLRRVRFDL